MSGSGMMPETRFGLLQLHSLGSLDLDVAMMDISPLARVKTRLRPATAPPKMPLPPFVEGKRRNSIQAIHDRVSRSSFTVFLAVGIKKIPQGSVICFAPDPSA